MLSFAAPSILAGAGFAALGPVAGTFATSWQASIGVVKAGSLFAWCQSAAMGGATGIFTGGIAGGVIGAGAGMLPLFMATGETLGKEAITEIYQEVFRRGKATRSYSRSLL